ncbi:MAG: hypothetical protein A3G24_06500 [Betaproteobacteria bacterium RIFCSPLOWO2_12_FULL_62_13]|nr:MAG: hypothetical protein A3G24_06500 [Betaproteobacteria bacterium RIFCSPLOWO2_12_FULL_62_13]
MLTHCARKEHPPLTVWEAEQLARAWLDRERRIAMDSAFTELYEVVAQILEAGHMNTEDLARLRAAYERA